MTDTYAWTEEPSAAPDEVVRKRSSVWLVGGAAGVLAALVAVPVVAATTGGSSMSGSSMSGSSMSGSSMSGTLSDGTVVEVSEPTVIAASELPDDTASGTPLAVDVTITVGSEPIAPWEIDMELRYGPVEEAVRG